MTRPLNISQNTYYKAFRRMLLLEFAWGRSMTKLARDWAIPRPIVEEIIREQFMEIENVTGERPLPAKGDA